MRWSILYVALAALALTLISSAPASAAPAPALTAVDAKIEIVWPHANASVQSARQVNITAYLFGPDTRRSVPCDFGNTVRLWRALNNQPVENVATGSRRTVTQGGVTFPVWDLNDVDVSAARDGANKYYFYITVDGIAANFNVWSHGADARTYLPNPKPPVDSGGRPDEVEAHIQVV